MINGADRLPGLARWWWRIFENAGELGPVLVVDASRGQNKAHRIATLKQIVRRPPEVLPAGGAVHVVDNVFKNVHESIDAQILQLLSTHTTEIIESLGLGTPGKSMDKFLEHYKELFGKVFLIRIQCPLEICLDRCKNRNKTDQVPLDLERIKSYNEQSAKVNLQWDLELNNYDSTGCGLSNEEILLECASIL